MISPDSGVLPLDAGPTDRRRSAVADLTVTQLQWASGDVAGLAAAQDRGPGASPGLAANPERPDPLTFHFCSQTGNRESFAGELARPADEQGIVPTLERDLDFDAVSASWSESNIAEPPAFLDSRPNIPHLQAVDTTGDFEKSNPFSAEVLVNQKVTGVGSSKDIRNIEFSLEGSGLRFESGVRKLTTGRDIYEG